MKTSFLVGMLLGVAMAPVMAQSTGASPGIEQIKALGSLNGEALACKQMALVDRIRARIVNEAPKSREIGEIFEAATTERFLAMGSGNAACADGRNLAERIEAATEALRTVFAPATGK